MDETHIRCERFLHMRYERTDCALMVSESDGKGNARAGGLAFCSF